MTTIAEVMAGVNGWHRWGNWSAHFFVDGKQLCNSHHTYAEGGMARGLPPNRPTPAERSPWGTLYGKVCARCHKLTRSNT